MSEPVDPSREQYGETGATLYDGYFTGVSGDVEFYVDEARRAGSPVLELGCGTGRILIPVAEAGVEVVGVDRSPSMLAIARRKLEKRSRWVRERVELVEGDMRTLALDRRFALVTIPYRAFLHNLTVDDQRRTLDRVRAHVVDGGRLVMNVFDPRVDLLAAGRWHPPAGRPSEFAHPETGHRVVVHEDMRYELEAQLVTGEFVFEERDAADAPIRTMRLPFVARYAFRYEMEHVLALSGFTVEALYGDFGRGPFRAGGEQIWMVRRA